MFSFLYPKSKEVVFWEWFERNSKKYLDFENNQQILFENLKKELNKIHPYLVFEFSRKFEDGSREFVISADGIKTVFPYVENLVESAPKINKWKVVAFRQPRKITHINYLNLQIELDKVYFSYNEQDGDINLSLFFENFYESPEWTSATFILLDNILGEYYSELYIGGVEKHKLNNDVIVKLLPIRQLFEIVKLHAIKMSN